MLYTDLKRLFSESFPYSAEDLCQIVFALAEDELIEIHFDHVNNEFRFIPTNNVDSELSK